MVAQDHHREAVQDRVVAVIAAPVDHGLLAMRTAQHGFLAPRENVRMALAHKVIVHSVRETVHTETVQHGHKATGHTAVAHKVIVHSVQETGHTVTVQHGHKVTVPPAVAHKVIVHSVRETGHTVTVQHDHKVTGHTAVAHEAIVHSVRETVHTVTVPRARAIARANGPGSKMPQNDRCQRVGVEWHVVELARLN
jgi:hypothetical protein